MVESSPSSRDGDEARVQALGLHPVKSARGLSPRRWYFDARGPVLDRHWMLVNDSHRFLSLREVPELARLRVDLRGIDAPDTRLEPDGIDLEFDGERMEVASSSAGTTSARLWGADRLVVDEGDEVADWLSDRLRRKVRMVRHDPLNDPWTQSDPPAENATTGLSDGYPVLVMCRSTLESTLGPDWSPLRFRANVLVDDAPADAEDHWRRVRIGEVELELVKPCVRCVATTVDPELGIRDGSEPLQTLRSRRTWEGRPTLGWNALVRTPGWIEVDDAIEVLESRPSEIEVSGDR